PLLTRFRPSSTPASTIRRSRSTRTATASGSTTTWSGLASPEERREGGGGVASADRAFSDPVPPQLYHGIDYSAFGLAPDGHCIQLYYYMEQVGWDGKVRPAAERRAGPAGGAEARGAVSD